MRRGINQLEMVLAFIIFIAAIGGSVFFLQTFRAQTDQFAQIDLWVEKLIDSAQDEVTLTVFQLNQTALGTVLFIALPVQEPMLSSTLTRDNGTAVLNDHQGTSIIVAPSGHTRLTLVQSASVRESDASLSDVAIDPSYFIAGAPSLRNVLTETRLHALQTNLTTSPTAILASLGLPLSLSVDFDFSAPGIQINSSLIPPGDREVRTVTRRVELMTTNGTFIFGTLQVTLW